MGALLGLLLAGCSADATEAPTSTPGNRVIPTNPNGQPFGQTGALTASRSVKAVASPVPTSTPVPTLVPTNTPAPTPTPVPPVSKGGSVIGAVLKDAQNLHPYKSNNESGNSFIALLYAASLTRRDPNTLALIPNAAASWNVNNSSLLVTFKLKDGLRWSDGQPLTADDYLWTYQQLIKPENSWPFAPNALYNPSDPSSNPNGIEQVYAQDPKTLIVKLHALSSDLVARADVIEPLPRHIWEGKDWNDPSKNPEILKPSVVSGPWILKEWKRGEKISFGPNDNTALYPRPNLDSLAFQIVPDSATALQRLKNNELDFFSPEASEQAQFEKLPNVQPYRWTPALASWQYLGFNFRKPYLQSRALRQALAYLTDRKTIIDKYAYGLGQPLYSDIVPWQPVFVPNVPRYDFNLEAAQRVLRDADYTFQNGNLSDSTGPLPPLKLVYNSPSPLRQNVAGLLKQTFSTVGVKVEIMSLDSESYLDFITNPNSDYDLFLGGWTTGYEPEWFGDMWSNIPQLNNGTYGNEALLNFYSAAQKEADPVRRKSLMAQVQALEAQELPYIYLFAQLAWLDVNKRVAGFSTGLLGPARNLYTDWFVVK